MLAYTTPKSWNFTFTIDGLASTSVPTNLSLNVWGVTDFSLAPDHHLLVSINGTSLANVFFDGKAVKVINATIPAGVLLSGSNTLTLTLPGDTGASYDMIDLDKYTITYPHILAATNGQLTFTASGNLFQVTNLPTANVEVYTMDAQGAQAQLSQVSVQPNGSHLHHNLRRFQPASHLLCHHQGGLVITRAHGCSQPSTNLNQPAQYLIISHPDFISGSSPLFRLVRRMV